MQGKFLSKYSQLSIVLMPDFVTCLSLRRGHGSENCEFFMIDRFKGKAKSAYEKIGPASITEPVQPAKFWPGILAI